MTSTAFSSLSRSHPVTRLALSVGASLAFLVGLARAFLHRRDVTELLELSDRELKDIGLIRNDVLGALAVPLHKDPSSILMVRSVERRAQRRAPALVTSIAGANKRPVVPFRKSELIEAGWR